jgi:hypothetical protein
MTEWDDTAFPSAEDATDGLTKREYFAATALRGLLAGYMSQAALDMNVTIRSLVDSAVVAADLLIERLNKR